MNTVRSAVAYVMGVAAVSAAVSAQNFDLAWTTIDGGGGTSVGGSLELSGTIGQPDAGVPMTGGSFQLVGGFWSGAGQEPETPCPADIAPQPNGDNFVNVDDLLAVINGWGACPSPCPPSCSADVAPIGGDCSVNVDDLLAVINAWGPCP